MDSAECQTFAVSPAEPGDFSLFVNNELKLSALEAQKLATTDALTSVANRYHFEKVLNHEVRRAHRFKEPLSIIAVDIDKFKDINDQYGHAIGDLALVEITKLIKSTIREIDLLARWGGDEFMIVLPHTSLDEANILAEKIRALIAGSETFKLTSSFGVAQLTRNESSMRLTIRADQALYKSKTSGRNAVIYV